MDMGSWSEPAYEAPTTFAKGGYAAKGGYEAKGGKGPSAPPSAPPSGGGKRPPFLPADAQQVTLFEKLGWFVSQESCDVFLQGMQAAGVMSGGGSSYEPQQVKRSYEAPSSYGNGKGSSLDPYYSYGKSMSKDGKDGMKGKSAPPSSFEGKGGKPPMKMAKTE